MFQSYAMRTPKPQIKKVRKSPVDVGIPAYTVLTLAPSSASSSSSQINHEQQRLSSSMIADAGDTNPDATTSSLLSISKSPKSNHHHANRHPGPGSGAVSGQRVDYGHTNSNSRILRNLALDISGSMHSAGESVGGGSYQGGLHDGLHEGSYQGLQEGSHEGILEGLLEGFNEGLYDEGSVVGGSIGGVSIGTKHAFTLVPLVTPLLPPKHSTYCLLVSSF